MTTQKETTECVHQGQGKSQNIGWMESKNLRGSNEDTDGL